MNCDDNTTKVGKTSVHYMLTSMINTFDYDCPCLNLFSGNETYLITSCNIIMSYYIMFTIFYVDYYFFCSPFYVHNFYN